MHSAINLLVFLILCSHCFLMKGSCALWRKSTLNNHYYYYYLGKAFDRVPWKLFEWVMRKKGIPVVLLRLLMKLYEGAKTSVKVNTGLSEEFGVKLGVHQGYVLLLFLFAIVVGVIELGRGCVS